MSYLIVDRPDVRVEYHSVAWELLLSRNYGGYGWVTWGVSSDNIATMKWTKF